MGEQTRWARIAREAEGDDYAAAYDERFRALAAQGDDVHGEASFVERLVPAPARVLDAGCGTGRVAVRLAERGYDVVGVDVDAAMVARARDHRPDLPWRVADLATLDLGDDSGGGFDVVLVAGNTVPLLEPGTLDAVCARLAAHVAPGGVVVCGFGLDADHLPGDCPVTPRADLDAAMARAGLEPAGRSDAWDATPTDGRPRHDAGYVVTLHRPRGTLTP